jgi:hypothetical protein
MGDDIEGEKKKEYVTLAEATRMVAETVMKDGDWSGMPLPVLGHDLVLEPRYRRQNIKDFQWSEYYDESGQRFPVEPKQEPVPSDLKVVNSWWNNRHRCTVKVVHDKNGRASARMAIRNAFSFLIGTLEAASAWPIEAEQKALQKLKQLIPQDQFELYSLTGHFVECSKKSLLTYIFRRCRPTLVMKDNEEETYLLCALCLHPIGYYADTWAGVMCPTDEVIAHLLMMRGCEAKYWANANQHPIEESSSGL